jgi:hypothetical protein
MNPYLKDLTAFAELLAACNVIHEDAVYDPEDYDGEVTMSRIAEALRRINAENANPPVRVTLSRRKGWRMPENTVKVCRPGKWGNPFKVGVHGNAAEFVDLFAKDIGWINSRLGFDFEEVAQLRGKNLACWCKQGTPCHADVLLGLANAELTRPEVQ